MNSKLTCRFIFFHLSSDPSLSQTVSSHLLTHLFRGLLKNAEQICARKTQDSVPLFLDFHRFFRACTIHETYSSMSGKQVHVPSRRVGKNQLVSMPNRTRITLLPPAAFQASTHAKFLFPPEVPSSHGSVVGL